MNNRETLIELYEKDMSMDEINVSKFPAQLEQPEAAFYMLKFKNKRRKG